MRKTRVKQLAELIAPAVDPCATVVITQEMIDAQAFSVGEKISFGPDMDEAHEALAREMFGDEMTDYIKAPREILACGTVTVTKVG